MPTNPKNQKEEARASLLRSLGAPKWTRAIVISFIKDPSILEFLKQASLAIGIILITDIDDAAVAGADIWITDSFYENIPLRILATKRVVWVIPNDPEYKNIFSEFDPMKFEWNAFIFEKNTPFQIFEKLIRALENMRYAGDKRMLLQNVEKTY